MEAVKLGRRRNHDLDSDGYHQIKRRVPNGACHMDATDTWHLSDPVPDKVRVNDCRLPLSSPKPELLPTSKPSIADGGHVSGVDSNTLMSEIRPTLPPGPRESERMKIVARWVNRISLDAPLWVQNSLEHAMPVSNPHEFLSELNRADNHMDANDVPKSSSPCPLTTNCLRNSPQQAQLHNKHSTSSLPFSTSAGLLGPRHPVPSPLACSRMPPPAEHIECLLDSRTIINPCPNNRFFDDLETGVIVKLFGDYFRSGNCPSVSEVRHRIANSVLQLSRNPTSIRSKIKRLQTNGRWTDFPLPNF